MSANKAKLPPSWATVRVDRVGTVRMGRQRSPDKHTGEHSTKYLRPANIKPAGIDLTDVLTMDFTPSERVIFGLRLGDVLLTESSGSSAQVGRAALWRGELSGEARHTGLGARGGQAGAGAGGNGAQGSTPPRLQCTAQAQRIRTTHRGHERNLRSLRVQHQRVSTERTSALRAASPCDHSDTAPGCCG